MGRYSLIALDMDGTLLNSEIKLSPGNREAILRAGPGGQAGGHLHRALPL